MAFKRYNTESAYEAAGLPESESRIALIDETERVAFDHVNTETTEPVLGDAVFLKTETVDGETVVTPVVLKGGDALRPSLIPANYTYVGPVLERISHDTVSVIHNTFGSAKYADVVQFTLTGLTLDGDEHSASIGLRLTGGTASGYGSNTTIAFAYQATDLATACQQLNTAIDDAKASIGFTNTVWAYMINDNYEKVDAAAEATKLMVQIDAWSDYRQYNKANSGCTLTHVSWRDMPVADWYKKTNGKTTNYRGMMNIARAVTYWSTNGRTPTANVAVGSEGGNTDPVKKTEFENSEYCAALREAYSDYETYIRAEFGIVFPQKFGVFSLPDGATLTAKYGPMDAPTKAGLAKYKFPALHGPLDVAYWHADLSAGKWHLWDVREGVILMRNENLKRINATQTKMDKTNIGNGTPRWFAQRYSVNSAWYFSGTSGNLYYNHVYLTGQVGAVALLKFKS